MNLFGKPLELPTASTALPGREDPITTSSRHVVLDVPIKPPFPDGVSLAQFGMGCFWGAEKGFWELDGVYTTAVGYAGGLTPNPTYQEVCTGMTGHNEVVLVAYVEERITNADLLRVFWESHDPTQGMRQGNDVGTQYRSGIYFYTETQRQVAEQTLASYQESLGESGMGQITTEILPAPEFYYAEEYHQQYLARNPGGYCGLGGTGVCLQSVQAATSQTR